MNSLKILNADLNSELRLRGPSRNICFFGGMILSERGIAIIVFNKNRTFISNPSFTKSCNLTVEIKRTMRIISYNVNGLRAAINKGFLDWLKTDPADVVCLQETKAQRENVDHTPFHNLGYIDYWFSAQKKGYSG